ncbi:MAG: NUDIX domain-containing protein [Prevotella sp.]|nr:NUDIX domain-containing protein [Prevotella sp.]
MDVKIKTATMNFHYCVRAIIKQDEKILMLCVNDAEYYHLPGGHVKIGETSENALRREIKEEVGFDINIDKLVIVNEQFYHKKDSAHHAIIFYYVASPKSKVSTENRICMEQGRTKLIKNELRWVTLHELKNLDMRPERIKNLIVKNELNGLEHLID